MINIDMKINACDKKQSHRAQIPYNRNPVNSLLTSICAKNAHPAVTQLFLVVVSSFIVSVGRNRISMHACTRS
jgi:hypothetical protein